MTSSTPWGRTAFVPSTQGLPGRMMAAFSPAMASSVSPRIFVWSSPMPVTAHATVGTAVVASQRPPRPTSSTAASTPACANMTMAAAVSSSNSVQPRRAMSAFSACTRAQAARAYEIPSAKASSLTGRPSTSTRST